MKKTKGRRRGRGRHQPRLQHELAEVGVLGECAHLVAHIGGVDLDLAAGTVGRGEADLLQKLLHHRVQPARADILDRLIDVGRELGQLVDRVGLELELDLLSRQQRLVLLDQASLGLGQDAAEIILGERDSR